MEPTQRLYPVKDALKLMGIGKTSLFEEIRNGKIAAVKFGVRTLISEEAIAAWQNQLKPICRFSKNGA